MALWDADLFHAENNEALDESEKHFDLPTNCLKN